LKWRRDWRESERDMPGEGGREGGREGGWVSIGHQDDPEFLRGALTLGRDDGGRIQPMKWREGGRDGGYTSFTKGVLLLPHPGHHLVDILTLSLPPSLPPSIPPVALGERRCLTGVIRELPCLRREAG